MAITDLATAVALVLIIEGALYALFPDGVKRVMTEVITWRASALRTVGLVALALGVGLVWWLWG